jgi:hypothetical protein
MNTQKNVNASPVLVEVPMPDTELKRWLVDYVGNRYLTSAGDVTIELIVEAVSKEFPEFLLAIAEENFFRGYEQALMDLQETNTLENEQ